MPKPRSYQEVIKKGINRALWIDKEEKKAKKRKPSRIGEKVKAGTLFAKRNKRLAIREAALRKVQVIITYRKTTTNEVNRYVVAPYSYRYRRLKVGLRKMLYAWDMEARRIKSFSLRNIQKVALTDRRYKPKWPIEIASWLILPMFASFFIL